MNSVRVKRVVYALSAAAIWGLAFAFQRSASAYIEAFTFNFYRCVLAVLSLSVFLFLMRKKMPVAARPGDWKRLAVGGLVTGALFFAASSLQQMGVESTEAGKAGFLTSLYTVLVPVFGVLFFRKKVPPTLWVSVFIAAAGLYLICVKDDFTLARGDALVLMCAVVFAFYILAVDHFVEGLNPVALSCAHFLVAGVLSGVAALLFEHPDLGALRYCLPDVLYVGVCSSAVAYTLEFAAHQLGNPVAVSLLLCMESVFSVLGGAALLHEYLTFRELAGCGVMFCAVVLAQLPGGKKSGAAPDG